MSIEFAPSRDRNRRRFHSIREVADMIGCDVSTVYRHIHSGALPQPVRIGGMVRIVDDELQACWEAAKAERASEAA